MWNNLKLAFGCDLRTLALFRIALALLILIDLGSRARTLAAHYSDRGILPRADLIEIFSGWRPSLHMVSGSTPIQGLLFAIAAVFALLLMAGYRTRLMTFLSWAMLASLQTRNMMIAQGGDILLLLLLFWGMFLPLGARFSFDAALDVDVHKRPNAYLSVAGVALLAQCMYVYWVGALLKSDPAWMPNGTAVELALRIDYLSTPIGAWLRQFPLLLKGLTYYVWLLELIGPALMFVPLFFPWVRLGVQALMILMHVGFILCIKIGIFPLVSIASILAFTPGWVWDKLGARLRTRERTGVKIYYDKDCGFCLKTCRLLREFLLFPETAIAPAQDYPDIHATMQQHNSWVVIDHDATQLVRWRALALLFRRSWLFRPLGWLLNAGWLQGLGDRFYGWVARNRGRLGDFTAVWLPYRTLPPRPWKLTSLAVAALALLVLWLNLISLPSLRRPLPDSLRVARDVLSLTQKWNMFAPAPSSVDGWPVVRGVTRDGTVVDVLRNKPGEPDWTRPRRIAVTYSSYRWRKYVNRLIDSYNEVHRGLYARYLCRAWNRSHGAYDQLAKLQFYFTAEKVELGDGPRQSQRMLLKEQDCKDERRPAARPPGEAQELDPG
jgi:predicted DCC family thiol-disulfide oxidoreductase YuxK